MEGIMKKLLKIVACASVLVANLKIEAFRSTLGSGGGPSNSPNQQPVAHNINVAGYFPVPDFSKNSQLNGEIIYDLSSNTYEIKYDRKKTMLATPSAAIVLNQGKSEGFLTLLNKTQQNINVLLNSGTPLATLRPGRSQSIEFNKKFSDLDVIQFYVEILHPN